MNLTPVFLLPAGLTLALIAMLAFGLYSLASLNRPRPVDPSHAVPSVNVAQVAETKPTAQTPNELDEWEANAQGAAHFAQHAFERQQFVRHASPSEAVRINASHEELRDTLHNNLHEGMGEEQFASPSAFMNGSHDDAPSSMSDDTPTSQTDALHCPHCSSPRVDTLNRARKAGSTIGSVAGATSGVAMALSGAEAGAIAGSFAGPIGTIFGGLAGAVIAGLVGTAAGCAAGSAVGAAIDENVLDNHQCLSCEHSFSAPRA